MVRKASLAALLVGSMILGRDSLAQTPVGDASTNLIRIVELAGTVEVYPAGAKGWITATNNQILYSADRIRTAENSRVALRWSGQSILPFGASTELEILPPGAADNQSGLRLFRGVLSFFHRDKPGRIHIITDGAVAGVDGTEFVLAVDDADVTRLAVVDGRVRLGNTLATLSLTNGEQAVVEPGKAPVRVAGFIANNLLQWCFYYPAVLDLNDLPLTTPEQQDLAASLAAYRSGDVLAALAKYPAGRVHPSDQERIYHAALLLSVGEVDGSEQLLASVSTSDEHTQRLADALHQLIAAVKRQPAVTSKPPQLATEFMADSYFQQSRAVRETSLRAALASARKAATLSPFSGFAWERVAELEFSFGDKDSALKALNESLALAPRNSQAHALTGFILAAQNDPHAAMASFNEALAIDSALGNAWLGRGLTRIRAGDRHDGREDLLVAAALEPQRAEFRSYLGKAYAFTGDYAHADRELALAKKLDPNDPTAWLYSALLNQQGNQINDAIRDLEKSEALNDNRSVYRSQLLLDEDQSVRAANLAGVYRDAGFFDLSMREAGRAVSSDYANYSAHLFLANSYDQLRDPNWNNLRYETPASAEFYMANLLAPPGAGTLSPVVSEPAYAQLFDQNRLGVVSDTEYLDRGAWFQEGAQFGVYNNFSYDLEAKYTSDPGQRPNDDEEHRDLTLTLKYQFTPQDSAFVSVEQDQINQGDVNEYFNQSSADKNFRFSEDQNPNLFIGYHHEWGPGSHTLFFASRRTADESADDPNAFNYFAGTFAGIYDLEGSINYNENVHFTVQEYSTELQQIFESPRHTTVLGAAMGWGDIRYQNTDVYVSDSGNLTFTGFLSAANVVQDFDLDYQHLKLYGYHTWQILDLLAATIGLDYDYMRKPTDVDTTPFAQTQNTISRWSPKAGLVFTPTDTTTVRAAYTRSLSGFIDDASVRLEPTEVAGFNQAFRSVLPGSVIGDTSGSKIETFELSLEQKFKSGTYLALSGEILRSKLKDTQGAFVFDGDLAGGPTIPTFPTGLNQSLDYEEQNLQFTVDQLLGKQLSVGAKYRLSKARLETDFTDINPANINNPPLSFPNHQNLDSLYHTLTLHANWNHPSGLFSSIDGDWYHQYNSGFSSSEPGEDFWQLNLYAGYRFWHRRAEATVGLLNATDQNYQLEPLSLYSEMARRRTLLVRFLVSF